MTQMFFMGAKPIKLNLEDKKTFARIEKKDDAVATLLSAGEDRSLFCVRWAKDHQNILFLNKDYFSSKYGDDAAKEAFL